MYTAKCLSFIKSSQFVMLACPASFFIFPIPLRSKKDSRQAGMTRISAQNPEKPKSTTSFLLFSEESQG
jgi:hypothetical protein